MSTLYKGARALIWMLMWFCAGATAQTKTVTYYYVDQLGNVLETTDGQGNTVTRSDYKPFGEGAINTEPNGPAYSGHVHDSETDLTYMQARYYDAAVGRFLSPDPIAPSSGNIFSTNRFAYVNNNPVRYNDPSGKCIWDACIAETYVAGIIIAAGAAYATHMILSEMRDHPITAPVAVASEAQAPTSGEAKEKVFEGTQPAAGDSGAKGEREGAPGGETAAWDKIDGKETQYPNGTKVKELADGGHADLHSSTKSKDYAQGTPSIKIRDPGNNVIGTVRYPKVPPPPPPVPPKVEPLP